MNQPFFRRIEVLILLEAIHLAEVLLVWVFWVTVSRRRRLTVLPLDLVNVRTPLVVLKTLLLW
jgi:hypothetical protein